MTFDLLVSGGSVTKTGGRPASKGVIPGDYALSVGKPASTPPPGWRWTLLSDVARLETGHTPSRKHPEYWGGPIPWIGIRDATGNHGTKIFETQQYTNALGIENSSARVLPPNTVCLSRTASVGYVVVMGRHMATSQDFVNWVCSPQLDYRFLKYVLLSEREALLRYASGTTHQTIYFPEAKAFHVCMPAIAEQHRIVDVLQPLDDRIALLHDTNATLEAIAQALFKSWFVDFDPVRAKSQGLAPAGMDEATAALFPEGFEESAQGLLPKGWRFAPVGDVVDGIYDGPHATPPESEEGPVFLGIKNLATGVELTERELISVLENQGVKKINSLNQPFDANFHNAIQEVDNKTVPTGTVVQVFQSGYMIEERCLRPAMVVVSSGGPRAAKVTDADPQ